MKIEVYKQNKDSSLDCFLDFVQQNLFTEKREDEIANYTVRTGFQANSDNNFGGGNFIFFNFRLDERKVTSAVKKRMLQSPKIKEIQKQVSKKEWKQIKSDLEHELKLKMPFGTIITNIVVYNNYVFLINPTKGIHQHISSILGKRLKIDLDNLASGIEDKEKHIIISPIKGNHSYTSKDNEFSVKGDLEKYDTIKKLTIISTSLSSIEATLTSDSFNISNNAFFNKVDKNLSNVDNLYYAIENFTNLLVEPICKLALLQDD